MNPNALNQYKSVDLSATVQTASAHQLVCLMFRGALEALAKAKGGIERKNIDLKTSQINKATSIILNLQGVLDLEKGGELAANLAELYGYSVRQLVKANRDNDLAILDEVAGILSGLFDAWASMPVSETLTG